MQTNWNVYFTIKMNYCYGAKWAANSLVHIQINPLWCYERESLQAFSMSQTWLFQMQLGPEENHSSWTAKTLQRHSPSFTFQPISASQYHQSWTKIRCSNFPFNKHFRNPFWKTTLCNMWHEPFPYPYFTIGRR